jgi:hypothetical protein
MKITEEVRELAKQGMADKSAEFKDGGQKIYAGGDEH